VVRYLLLKINGKTLFEEPTEEMGNGAVYGTIQDGGGNGLVMPTPQRGLSLVEPML
jgi:hypothetical protein